MGFHIMSCLLQSSETLRLLLYLLDEGVGLLESYQVKIKHTRGKSLLELWGTTFLPN